MALARLVRQSTHDFRPEWTRGGIGRDIADPKAGCANRSGRCAASPETHDLGGFGGSPVQLATISGMLHRRQFLGWVAGLVPAAALVRSAHAATIAELNAAPETLDALGLAILPTELGDAQIRRVVASFLRWLDRYREGAELNHAYGASRLTFAGPTPATRWMPQLDALEAAAQKAHGRAFSATTVAQRRAIVKEALAAERGAGIPTQDRATHIATALLGHYFASAQATDLCYGVSIARQTCRPLSKSSEKPL
jgi:hypothetical protein